MFDHLEIHVSDLAASRAFYHEALGLPTFEGELVEWGDFGIVAVDAEHPLTRRLHVAFGAESRDDVDAWWNRLTEAGYESDGEPGPRPQYTETYYGAFVLDPDGQMRTSKTNGRESAVLDAGEVGERVGDPGVAGATGLRHGDRVWSRVPPLLSSRPLVAAHDLSRL